MKFSCLLLFLFIGGMNANKQIFLDGKIFKNEREYHKYLQERITYPGTKWCGPGNTAKNDNDLGTETKTDMCCREHDHCPDIIMSGESKHGLKNTSLFTRLRCDCDEKLRRCLKNANTKTANEVGFIYFLANSECFQYEPKTNKYKWFKLAKY